MARMVKCAYVHCKCSSDKFPKEEAVKVGNRYFHKDCFKTKKEIDETVELFLKKINSRATIQSLRKVVNDIVFGKNVPSDELLFGLKYYIKNNMNLNYPHGLYYVVQNKKVHNEYIEKISKKKVRENIKNANVKIVKEEEFVYNSPSDDLNEKWGIT